MYFTLFTSAWAIAQIIICFNSLIMDAREGLCTDEQVDFFRVLDASGNAARSNFVPSAVFTVLTSSVPYLVLYVIPFALIITRSNKLPHIMNDGIVSWLALLSNTILKSLAKQPRPSAYAACISSSTSYGMPSGHATWAIALFVYALRRRKDSWLGHLYGKRIMWGVLLWGVAIPFTRYELQYHTVLQIVIGGFIGAALGWLGSQMSYSRIILTRLQSFFLWLFVSSLLEGEFNVAKKVPPLVVEILVAAGVYWSMRNNNYSELPQTDDDDNTSEFGLNMVESKKTQEKDEHSLSF